jgi:kynurenine formamidase
MCLPGTIEAVRERVEQDGLPRLDRRKVLLGAAGAALATAVPAQARGPETSRNRSRLQDLTHVFRKDFPLFLGVPVATERDVVVTVAANGFYAQRWAFWEHAGTHLDAPAHFVADGRQSPELTLDELVRPLVVIDISKRAARDPDALVLPSDLTEFERRHGRIPRGAVVAMYSGWDARAGSAQAYRNVGADGKQHFPGFGKAAVEALVAERDIAAIGVDTLSLDPGRAESFDAHVALLSANRYGIENLANLRRVPPRGATIYVGVVPWEQGSGGPARVFASW